MKLTPHFSLDEFIQSNTAHQHGISNEPTPAHLENIRQVAAALEVVREMFGGRAVVISSGYRNPQVNRLVGGVANSAHALGFAADFHVAGFSDLEVARRIRDQGRNHGLRWDQLIYERGRCVHLSVGPQFRQHVLSQPGGPGSHSHPGINP